MSHKFRGALIGCGYFAQFHAEAWRRIPEIEIVAACDARIERARAVSNSAYTSAEQLLSAEQLDFLDIATRPDSHLEFIQMAAAHNIHVICQKPMAPGLAQAQAIASIASASGIRVMIHENWRWQPWYRKAAELINAGSIGQPLAYGFRTRKRDGMGPEPYTAQPYMRDMPRLLIYETLVHHIDVSRFLFGEIASIYALSRRRNPLIAGEDQAILTLRHQPGVDGWIDGHRYVDTIPDSPVMGEAIFDGDEGVLQVTPSGDVTQNGKLAWRNDVITGYRGDSVYATQAHFVECLLSGAPFETDAADYLRTFAAAEAAYTSIERGQPVAF